MGPGPRLACGCSIDDGFILVPGVRYIADDIDAKHVTLRTGVVLSSVLYEPRTLAVPLFYKACYHTCLRMQSYALSSTDGGESWSTPAAGNLTSLLQASWGIRPRDVTAAVGRGHGQAAGTAWWRRQKSPARVRLVRPEARGEQPRRLLLRWCQAHRLRRRLARPAAGQSRVRCHAPRLPARTRCPWRCYVTAWCCSACVTALSRTAADRRCPTTMAKPSGRLQTSLVGPLEQRHGEYRWLWRAGFG